MDSRTVPPAHPLTFRVMRLTAATPSRRPPVPFTCSKRPLPDCPDIFTREAPTCEGEGAPASVGTVAVLPASFGSIYASETFRSVVSTFNISPLAVQAVSVTIEIHTSSQRRIGLIAVRPAQNLPSREALTHVIEAPLPELGVHALVCAATYVDCAGVSQTLRQVFRFNVLPPLEPFVNVVSLHRSRTSSVSPNFTDGVPIGAAPSISQNKEVMNGQMAQFLVDLRVLNTMPVPVYITSANLVTNSVYTIVTPLLRSDDPSAAAGDADPNVKRNVCDGVSELQDTSASDDNITSVTRSVCSIPYRNASTGVGDTRSFLFYVARPRETHELTTTLNPSNYNRPVNNPGQSAELYLQSQQISKPSDADSATIPAGDPAPCASVSERTSHIDNDLRNSGDLAGDSAYSQGSGVPANHSRQVRREIGCFSLQWHSGNGEYGRMDNVMAAYEPAERSTEIDLQIAAVPQDIRVQEPFGARCIARNNSDKPIRLYLQVRRDLVGEIVPVGTSGVSLGEVSPAASAECLLTFLPLTSGLHSLSGVRVVNIDSRESFDADAPVISVV